MINYVQEVNVCFCRIGTYVFQMISRYQVGSVHLLCAVVRLLTGCSFFTIQNNFYPHHYGLKKKNCCYQDLIQYTSKKLIVVVDIKKRTPWISVRISQPLFILSFQIMNTNRACGCKSFNSCYLCEAEFGLSGTEPALERIDNLDEQRLFCPVCRCLYDPCVVQNRHICGHGEQFHGIELYPNFISVEEEQKVLRDLDKVPWDVSQSGRRKQNYGPKANFKKRKVKLGSFQGTAV